MVLPATTVEGLFSVMLAAGCPIAVVAAPKLDSAESLSDALASVE